jgi:hypothetical protein
MVVVMMMAVPLTIAPHITLYTVFNRIFKPMKQHLSAYDRCCAPQCAHCVLSSIALQKPSSTALLALDRHIGR